MSSYDFVEKIRTLNKEIKIHWERLLQKYTENTLSKDEVRAFKSGVLIPTLNKITDLTALIIERKRDNLYKEVAAFFRNVINLSTYYQRHQRYSKNIGFNYSSETEHLGHLLPGYEATVRMLIVGSIAVVDNVYDFVSLLGDERVVLLRKSDGEKLYRSIFYYPWYENGWGAGNLTNFFEDARKKLSEDEQIRERYFSLVDDSYVDSLCQFNFLQCVKIEILGENDWGWGFPFYPNFARDYFNRVEDIVIKFKNRDPDLLSAFPISENDFRNLLAKYVEHIGKHWDLFGPFWRALPKWFQEYLPKSSI